MVPNPKYTHRWKIIPFSIIDDMNNISDECYITWIDDLKSYQDSINPPWEIIAAPFDINIATHICNLHNEWIEKYYDRGLTYCSDNDMIYSFGGCYPKEESNDS